MKKSILLIALLLTACQSGIKQEKHINILDTLKKQSSDEILVMTLNLHTYQEEDALAKLNHIADMIAYLDIDLIAFQECAQHKDSKIVKNIIRKDNMAHIISSRLKKKYNKHYDYRWDWSHYGWNVWEEGIAILSRTSILNSDSTYVSTAKSTRLIDSRKVLMIDTKIPGLGKVRFSSAHLSWRKNDKDQEQNKQVTGLLGFLSSEPGNEGPLQIICGDFNMSATATPPHNEAYTIMTNSLMDSYAHIHPGANDLPPSPEHKTIGKRGRIDFIFNTPSPHIRILDSRIVFKKEGLGLVSDHQGVITKYQIISESNR